MLFLSPLPKQYLAEGKIAAFVEIRLFLFLFIVSPGLVILFSIARTHKLKSYEP